MWVLCRKARRSEEYGERGTKDLEQENIRNIEYTIEIKAKLDYKRRLSCMPAMRCGAEKGERNGTYTVLPNLRSTVDERNRERMDIEKHGVIQSGYVRKERNMSIVMRMEMPKCCDDCTANYDCMACGITGTQWYGSEEFDPSNGRLPDCPIICQLPEEHGRLVDADKEIDFHIDDFERVKAEGVDVYSKAYSLSDLCDGITYAYDHANIIVPAEVERSEI